MIKFKNFLPTLILSGAVILLVTSLIPATPLLHPAPKTLTSVATKQELKALILEENIKHEEEQVVPVEIPVTPLPTYHEMLLEVSYYCACAKCCDIETGITASGARVQEGVTIAAPKSIPFGTEIYIEDLGKSYIVQDRGGYITELGNNTMRVDIYIDSHERALQMGRHVSVGRIYY